MQTSQIKAITLYSCNLEASQTLIIDKVFKRNSSFHVK